MTSSVGGRACAGESAGRTRVRRRSGVKGHSRDDRPSPSIHFNDFFQRRNDCTRGTLAHGILETRLCRVALLSNHTPPLLALIICLTVDVGMFLALLLTTRLAFFLLIFLGKWVHRWLPWCSKHQGHSWEFFVAFFYHAHGFLHVGK